MPPDRIFRSLLWCFPAPFRDEYGAEMARVFTEEVRAARAQAGWRAEARVYLRSLRDLFTTAMQEHLHMINRDVRYALRLLAGQPGFTAVAVLSLALGIGANLAIFSLVDAVLLRMLPVRDPESLVMLTEPGHGGVNIGATTGERGMLTYEEFLHLRDRAGVFAQLMAAQSSIERVQARINERAEPEEIRERMVSAEYFATLGVPAWLGRTLDASDGARPALAVISHDFWQRRFGGKAEAVGARLALRKAVFTVIGVMPPAFFGERVGERPDVWLPLSMQPVILPGRDWLRDDRPDLQKVMWLHAFGRLRSGVSQTQAQAAANGVFQQALQSYYAAAPSEEIRRGFLNQSLRLRPAGLGASGIRGQFGPPLTILLAAAGVVLLIACANLGNLMLARTMARGREIAVRLALGAGRGNLMRQMLTESMVIAMAGGILGLGAAWVMRRGLLALAGDSVRLPEAAETSSLAFAFGLTIVTGLLLGLLPCWRAIRMSATGGLKEQGRGVTSSVAWLRVGKAVVVAQVALSLPLLLGAGLLVRTLENLRTVDLGFVKEKLLMIEVDVETAGYEEARRQALFERLYERVRSTPGVLAASYSRHGMLMSGDSGDEVQVEGYVRTGKGDGGSLYEHVGPGFFSTLGIPLRLGREITERDRPGGLRVCVVNEAFAQKFFAGRSPIGLHVTQLFGPQRNTFEIVGVVANARKRGLRGQIEHRYYVPVSQPIDVPTDITFAVRTAAAPEAVANAVRRAILAEDPHLPVTAARTVEELLDERTVQDRLLARLSASFGVVALLLSAIGLYGVLSYGVTRRTSEIGIRKALGAGEGAVVSMILRETWWLVLGGLAAGVVLAWASLRWIESRLFGLTPSDPGVFGATVALLALVALAAAWIPARRASRVDPLVAIRYE